MAVKKTEVPKPLTLLEKTTAIRKRINDTVKKISKLSNQRQEDAAELTRLERTCISHKWTEPKLDLKTHRASRTCELCGKEELSERVSPKFGR